MKNFIYEVFLNQLFSGLLFVGVVLLGLCYKEDVLTYLGKRGAEFSKGYRMFSKAISLCVVICLTIFQTNRVYLNELSIGAYVFFLLIAICLMLIPFISMYVMSEIPSSPEKYKTFLLFLYYVFVSCLVFIGVIMLLFFSGW